MPAPARRSLAASAAVLLAVAAPAAALAQGQALNEPDAVARAVDALTRAMVARDRATLAALTAPALSYGHSAGRIENRQEFIENVVSGPSQFRFINLSDQTIGFSENEAIVRHLFTAETQDREGKVTPVRIGVLQVWQKQGDAWKLLARQAYRL